MERPLYGQGVQWQQKYLVTGSGSLTSTHGSSLRPLPWQPSWRSSIPPLPMLPSRILPATSVPAPAREPGSSPAILSPTPSSFRLVHGHRVSSAVRISFCSASRFSPPPAFFAVSRRHFRFCFWLVFFKESEAAASSLWRKPSWQIHSNRENEARPSRFMASSLDLGLPSARRSAVGSRTITRGDGSSIS